jgi:large subunit ribosomal protein L24e
VRNDCKSFRFCRTKCHRAFIKKRNPRKVRWTKAFRKTHGKELAVDSTFDFERKRNVPIKYNRELMANTLVAMKRIQEIRQAREKRFYEQRMKISTKNHKMEALREIKNGMDLLVSSLVQDSLKVNKVTAEKIADQESGKMAVDSE